MSLLEDIDLWLQNEKELRRMTNDRYLHDYSKVWHGINPEAGGVVDELPASYAQACMDALNGVKRDEWGEVKREYKQTASLPDSGITVAWDDNNPTVTLFYGHHILNVARHEIDALIGILQPLARPAPVANNITSTNATYGTIKAIRQRDNEEHKRIQRTKEWQKHQAVIQGKEAI
jgi:hypothetical protein